MKSALTLTALSLVFSATAQMSVAQVRGPAGIAGRPYYTLACHGAGLSVRDAPPVGLTMAFRPGTYATASRDPAPGTCSWLDRGFRPGEPGVLYIDNSVYGAASTIIQATSHAEVFHVQAYNNGLGDMVVVRVGR